MTGQLPDRGHDEPPFGQQPGINQSPLGSSFRDGPGKTPASGRTLLLGAIPVIVIGVVLLVLLIR